MDTVKDVISSDWAWLPINILDSILDRITNFFDYVRFCSVCKSWRLIAMEENGHHHIQKQRLHILKTCQNQIPMLMIPTSDNSEKKRSFYSIMERTVYNFELPVSYDRRCFGSSYGWLFTIDKCMVITLSSPFINRVIHLPEFKDPLEEYRYWVDDDDFEYFINKGILSSDPTSNPHSYTVVVIYGGMKRLSFYKSGDETWTFLDLHQDYVFSDIIWYEGQIYAVNSWSDLVCVDIITDTRIVIIETIRILDQLILMTYLVKSQEGDLLMVKRILEENDGDEFHFKTRKFEVFKVLHSTKMDRPMWKQIKSLGDQALFLGDNHSLSLSTLDFVGCQSNGIYYTDHYFEVSHYVSHGSDDDTGIFNLEYGSFGSHYTPKEFDKPLLPVIWIVPNLKEVDSD